MQAITKIQAFLSWWGTGLYQSLPTVLQRLFQADGSRLVLQMQSDTYALVAWQSSGKQQRRGEFYLTGINTPISQLTNNLPKQHSVELQLGEWQHLVLQRHFPESVKDNIRQVVGYQLDRLTPFTLENAYFDTRIVQHDKAQKEVLVDIYVAPKTLVDGLVQGFQIAGFNVVQRVSVAKVSGVNLLQDTQTESPKLSRWPLYFALAGLIAALIVPVGYKLRRVDQIDGAISELRHSASEQLAIRDQLTLAQDALGFLAEKRKSSPVVLDVVEQLSSLIPTDTWLERLTVEGKKVELRGESGKALSLIDTLENAPLFSDVRFKSPVVRNKENGRDRFHIEATVEVTHE